MFLNQGFDLAIMQSHEYADRIIEIFKEYIQQGYNPNICQDDVYREAGVYNLELDVLESDMIRIQREVEGFYRMWHR